jgi:hypothetical protein
MKAAFKIVCVALVIAAGLYSLQTERKYDLLVKEINSLRFATLNTIDGQASV